MELLLDVWKKHGLEVGFKKTKFMNLKKNIPPDKEMPTKLKFLETNEYTYLGSEVAPRSKFKKMIRDFAKKYREITQKWNRTAAVN